MCVESESGAEVRHEPVSVALRHSGPASEASTQSCATQCNHREEKQDNNEVSSKMADFIKALHGLK